MAMEPYTQQGLTSGWPTPCLASVCYHGNTNGVIGGLHFQRVGHVEACVCVCVRVHACVRACLCVREDGVFVNKCVSVSRWYL